MGVRIGNSRDLAAGLLYILFGGAVALGSLDLTLGTPRNMGAGFFPFAVALALAATGIVVAAGAFRRDGAATGLGEWRLRPIFLVCLAVAAFALLLPPAGLLVAAPVLIGICALATRTFAPRRYLLTVAVLLPLSWAVFVALLGLPVPLLPVFAGG